MLFDNEGCGPSRERVSAAREQGSGPGLRLGGGGRWDGEILETLPRVTDAADKRCRRRTGHLKRTEEIPLLIRNGDRDLLVHRDRF